jgi:hypothetical protein
VAEWSFLVPPDITVTLCASKRPSLLTRALGPEIAREPNATLVLDLGGGIDASAPIEHGRYKTVPWRSQVTAHGGKQNIAFQSPLFREYLAMHIALLPALRQLLLDRNVALIAGAACASGYGATLLAGETGAGKTAALLAAAARGVLLIGDEYVGVSTAGAVTPVLRVFALRRGTLAAEPERARRLSGRRRLALLLALLAARLSFGRLDPLVHVSPAELGVELAPDRPQPIATLLWLDRAAPENPQPMTASDAVEALLGVQQAHDRAYGVPPDSNAVRWRETLSRGLERVRRLRAAAPLAPGVLDGVVAAGSSEAVARP